MANKIFLDTNVVIDFIVKREFQLASTEQIFNSIYNDKLEAYISESVISTSIYLLRHYKINSVEILRTLCKFINVLPFNRNVLFMPVEKYTDSEDGLLYFLASHNKMNYFITRNKKDFRYTLPTLPVMTPDEFINTIIFQNDLQK